MDVPTYPPSSEFEQPATRAHVLSLDDFSLRELMNIPAAWEIVVRHLPSVARMVDSQMIQPHLGNFTLRDIEVFARGTTPEVRTAINDELRRLPPM